MLKICKYVLMCKAKLVPYVLLVLIKFSEHSSLFHMYFYLFICIMRVLSFNESLQWSPTEPNVFASCSVDKTIAIWDTRGRSPAASFKAHNADVNVLSWNRYYSIDFLCSIISISIIYLFMIVKSPASDNIWPEHPNHTFLTMMLYFIVLSRLASCMLASGSDDGTISIRDLRLLKV